MSPEWTKEATEADRSVVRTLRLTMATTILLVLATDAAAVIASTTGGILAGVLLQVPTIAVNSLLLHDILRRAGLLRTYCTSERSDVARRDALLRYRSATRHTVVDSAWTRLVWARAGKPRWRATAREQVAIVVLLTTTGFAADQLTGEGVAAAAAAGVTLVIYALAKNFMIMTDVAYVGLLTAWTRRAVRGGDADPGEAEGV